MRYLSVILAVMVMVMMAPGYCFARAFNGQGPGESTIGTGGDYASLAAACDAVSSQALTGGDWIFLILNDLDEPNNIGLAQENTNGHTITFRPAPGTSPVVTFTTTTENAYPARGNFNIGVRPGGGAALVPTSNIVIDGSNDPSTNTRSLTWRQAWQHSDSVFEIIGNSDYITIRNCRIYFRAGVDSNYGSSAVEFSPQQYTSTSGLDDAVPDFGLVENCYINLSEAYFNKAAIGLNNRSSLVSPAGEGMAVLHNEIVTGSDAIYIRNCSDAALTGNRITINARLRGQKTAIKITGATASNRDGKFKLDSNTLLCTGTRISHWTAMQIDARNTTSSYVISNNMISSLAEPPSTPVLNGFSIMGVHLISDTSSTVEIAHNSFNFHNDVDSSGSIGRCRALLLAGSFSPSLWAYSGNTFVHNNIFRMAVKYGVVFAMPDGPGVLESDNNIIHTGTSCHVGWNTEAAGMMGVMTTLEDWQTSTGQDQASVAMDPFVAAELGSGTWTGPADDPGQDLHFTSFPGDVYLAPPVPGITTDVDGETRGQATTLAGADEVDRNADVRDWHFYQVMSFR